MKKEKFFLMLPLQKGDPYFLGQTFMYDIFIQDKNSPAKLLQKFLHVVRFLAIK
jgi:hypothetical protein